MALRKNEDGFTFINLFFALSLLAISLPFVSYLILYPQPKDNLEEISIQQFFRFVRNDLIQSVGFELTTDSMQLELPDHSTATIEIYQNSIRRRVDGRGHEIYLRNIKHVEFLELNHGIRITVTSLKGDKYEKTLIFYE
ncbi:competence type IV pilus minor pilin ComGF [Virgibacillus xinjiangensis]|uniref:Competence type IV pilus minor pilin ComGF n=1 Tax=Virgibacillus xinjiangensis TaxID=393090 RepID=A0ABV7CRV7_9BACI